MSRIQTLNYNAIAKQIAIIKPDGSIFTMKKYLKSRTDEQIRNDVRDVLSKYNSAIDNVRGRKLKTVLITLIAGITDTSKPIPVKND